MALQAMVYIVVNNVTMPIQCPQSSHGVNNSWNVRGLNDVGASGGIVTCWNSRDFSCTEVVVGKYSLTVRLEHFANKCSFFLTNVYGPPAWEGKTDLCNELSALKSVCNGRWILCGDFNLTKDQNERRGRSWSTRLTTMFTDLLNSLELIDIPLGNKSFTWSNMQLCPTLAKLDQFIVSTEWDHSFPLSKEIALPRITSNHALIVLSTANKRTSRLFRFEKVWLTLEDFRSQWEELNLKGPSALTFAAKLRHYRKRIKEWCKDEEGTIRRDSKTRYLGRTPAPNGSTGGETESVQAATVKVILDEEILWKTRERQHWLKEGDGNTKFFHAMANGR
ncbi:hypothetical protein ACMD2_24755 [Ananas comosus]|uniref:Endonuclease/exonuclease/phosphatase domain-containing protein n=1 Tax=Ananas comosus TaxID=4615 RepID=A0A199UZG2_ANACO|nr:hypothetical protein ACMD2_24755 [Ananas comosus]